MKTKAIILLIVFLLLLAFYYQDQNLKLNLSSDSSVHIVEQIERDKISRIRISGSVGSYDLNRVEEFKAESPFLNRSNWVLREPLFAPVNDESISSLIDLILSIRGEAVKLSDLERQNLGEYGLVPPLVILTIGSDDKKIVISLGHPNKVTEQLFLQKEGDANLYLISDKLLGKIQATLNTIRSHEVLKFDSKNVYQLDLIKDNNFFRLKKGNCETQPIWTVSSDGLEMKADDLLVERKLSELSKVRVNKIYDNPLDILQFTGLASPHLIFKISFSDSLEKQGCSSNDNLSKNSNKKEVIIQVGKGIDLTANDKLKVKSPSYFLKISGENVIYELENSAFGDWTQGADHFRSREPLSETKINTSEKMEIIIPNVKCALFKPLDAKDDLKTLEESFQSLKLDTIVSLEEFSDFEKLNGISVTFSDSKCVTGFKNIGYLNQDLGDGTIKPVASVVKILKCNEKELYGVAEHNHFLEVTKPFERYCIK